jgi:hypothetical protein
MLDALRADFSCGYVRFCTIRYEYFTYDIPYGERCTFLKCVNEFNSLVEVGVFLVMWVDHDQQEADLIPLGTVSSVEESVSFSEIQAYSEDRTLKSA